jgi:hypothetical protein
MEAVATKMVETKMVETKTLPATAGRALPAPPVESAKNR